MQHDRTQTHCAHCLFDDQRTGCIAHTRIVWVLAFAALVVFEELKIHVVTSRLHRTNTLKQKTIISFATQILYVVIAHLKKNPNRMATADGVVVLSQIIGKRLWIQ